ncbi:ribulose-phosphate 3-epimerase [Saccharopolyspora pogona]|uniref:ribulose-phosphate 3-epimerase n=1 Tax=Saccharopolyspora pogona TaxID=333966 RepID=UPI001686A0A4|nr:ribulose-phosphate 3-epimerase [Saccharopolyspora pogona]
MVDEPSSVLHGGSRRSAPSWSLREPALVASVLGADYARLGEEVASLTDAGVDRIQWDVMDWRFVPNMTFGPDVVGVCRQYSHLPFEAHLMVQDPGPMLARFASAGCETIIVHAETCPHLLRTLSTIRDLGVQAGVAVNPSTPIDFVRHVLDQLDQIVIMTVNPGFGGQRYIAAMEEKVSEVRALVDRSGRPVRVEVDGGISTDTALAAWYAGAEFLVAGSAVLSHPGGKRTAVDELRRALTRPVPAP